ncbi:MAG: RIP metalloprotease RseP [Hyphomicrobium sp.]|nr:RIP metalloprotease RseP [Hyphomicrobium sp.]
MDALSGLLNPITYGLAFLFVLTVVVFFHELGHFLVARWCGVNVKAFSIGFGREIYGFNDRHGTRWRIAWIPLGGYVKFMDDENAASVPSPEAIAKMSPEEREGSFHAKPVWKRAAVVAAGPAANFILAIVIFTLWYSINGVHSTDARIDEVVADGPAAKAGLMVGDLIVEIDGRKIDSFERVQQIVGTNVGTPLNFKVDRGGAILDKVIVPEVRVYADAKGDKQSMVVIGVRRTGGKDEVRVTYPGPVEAVGLAVERTHFIVASTLGYLRDVFLQKQSGDQLGGPIRIADIAGRVAQQGSEHLIHLAAFISVSVGLINLFPIPLLDGGHLMFYAIEAVRRKPLSEGAQEIGFRIGMALVLGLMIFSFFNDLPILKRWIVGTG